MNILLSVAFLRLYYICIYILVLPLPPLLLLLYDSVEAAMLLDVLALLSRIHGACVE
jgi:hypothetical protein